MSGMIANNQNKSNPNFHSNRYAHGILHTKGKKTCSEIASSCGRSHDSVTRDLNAIVNNLDELKIMLQAEAIEANRTKPGYLINDSTLLVKEHSGKMEGVSRQWSGSNTKLGIGLLATVWTDLEEELIPVDAFTWQRGDPSKIETATDRAIVLAQRIGAKGVLSDAAFATVKALKNYIESGVYAVMRFHSNRMVKLAGDEKAMPIKDHPAFKMKGNNRHIMHRVEWKGIDLYVMAFKIKHKRHGWMRIFLVTTMPINDAKKVAALYKRRWKIETFFRTCKQKFGLGDCQVISLKKQEAHAFAVFLAYRIANIQKKKCLSSASITKSHQYNEYHVKLKTEPSAIIRSDRNFGAYA